MTPGTCPRHARRQLQYCSSSQMTGSENSAVCTKCSRISRHTKIQCGNKQLGNAGSHPSHDITRTRLTPSSARLDDSVRLTLSLEDNTLVSCLLGFWAATADLLAGFDPDLVGLFAFPAACRCCWCGGLVPHCCLFADWGGVSGIWSRFPESV